MTVLEKRLEKVFCICIVDEFTTFSHKKTLNHIKLLISEFGAISNHNTKMQFKRIRTTPIDA